MPEISRESHPNTAGGSQFLAGFHERKDSSQIERGRFTFKKISKHVSVCPVVGDHRGNQNKAIIRPRVVSMACNSACSRCRTVKMEGWITSAGSQRCSPHKDPFKRENAERD